MKRLPLLLLGFGLVCFAGCDRKVTITSSGETSTITPANVSVSLAKGDRIIFRNKDERVHRLSIGGVTTTLFPPNPRAERPSTLIWTVPPGTTPPASITWTCEAHPGEKGVITVAP
jgi:hypothetical protein